LNDVLGGLEVDLGFETNAVFKEEVVISLVDVELFQASVATLQANDVRDVQREAGCLEHEAQGVVETEHRLTAHLRQDVRVGTYLRSR
jgi:hypothetical protein